MATARTKIVPYRSADNPFDFPVCLSQIAATVESPKLSSHVEIASSSISTFDTHSHASRPPNYRPSGKAWIDPASLPNHGDVKHIRGNAPEYVKQLNSNTFFSYGVGDEDCFGHKVGKNVKFVDVNIDRRQERQGRMEATTVAEVQVSKRVSSISTSSLIGLSWDYSSARL
ncbi:hypothetical protein C0993_007877 [Termitomyces sp. T159_Od127]|nr:hypothetical protein C0993_007877 [Termitomyces sp. T159_Od127]